MSLTLLYREYSLAQQGLEQQIGLPICVQCGNCCRGNTPIAYGLEAAHAVSYLIGQGKLYEFQRRIEGWLLEKHKECPTYEQAKVDRMTFGLPDKIKSEVLRLSHTPCPFFENNTCLIHEVRPLVCRAYGVTRTSEGCNRPRGRGETLSRQMITSPQINQDLKDDLDFVLEGVPRPTWKHAGFFPTLIFAHAWPESFAKLTGSGLIATAKLTMTYPSMAVIFEDEVKRISLTERDLFHNEQKSVAGRI
ncbi:MAG: YkgJ family cysteine cluster protein [Dehalococcoidales bacterium]|nr:YkgJ family cysteine cluster protein [Dehalococcoidales bacterium]